MNIQTDVEKIAMDYLKIAGAKDLKDLEINHIYFYEKFIEEKNRVNNKKTFVSVAEITSKAEEIAEKNILKIYCKNCNKELFRYSNKIYLVPEEVWFSRKENKIKTKCSCGKVEEFQKLENRIEIVEGSEK